MTATSLALIGLMVVAVAGFGSPPTPPTETMPTEPTETPMIEMLEVTFHEFERTKQARCGGESVNTKTCWTDSAGSTFRYGCMEGDNRVFTDFCGDLTGNCDECDGQFKWGGEKQETCYDDGTMLYEFFCDGAVPETKPYSPDATEESSGRTTDQKSCTELGWPLQPGDLSVCGFSKVVDNKCAEPSSFNAAKDICEAAGARLCTAEELENDETKGTGCKGDCGSVWSSDECELEDGSTGHQATFGARKCAKKFPAVCGQDEENMVVRCCSDVLLSDGTKISSSDLSLPEGLTPAVARDYKKSDGSCGVEAPIAQYSCWTNPKDKKARRFACHDDDMFVYQQYCGSDSKCQPSSCTGDWTKTGEMAEQCFTSKSGGYLYQYLCPGKRN